MNTMGVMTSLWTEDEGQLHTLRVAKRFEKLNNIPVRVFQRGDFPGFYLAHSHFARYHMWRLLPSDVERVVYLDADIIPLRPLPELPEEDFAAVMECNWLTDEARKGWNILDIGGMYFNSGFFIANRKTEALFQAVLDRQTARGDGQWPWLYDQTSLNIETQIAIKRGDLTFKLLGREWCNQVAKDSEVVPKPYMLHFAGMPTRVPICKLRLIADIINRIEEMGG